MASVESAVKWALEIAQNNKHGYSQEANKRWGNPDYDCSSFVISAFEQAGFPVKSKGGATYTGNMLNAFKKCGFYEVKISERKRGDVLLNSKHHTAIVVDKNTIVHASINENGKTTGGKDGDQNGREICTRAYYSYPWNYCLRHDPEETTAKPNTNAKPVESPKEWTGRVTTKNDPLNLRATSDPKSRIIGILARGKDYKFTGEAVNGMYKLSNSSGWCAAKYITKL